jgi:CMP-N-acetylneuraminic acid synthetase/spore coat polysaccharide biosynthesis predicted glycosyltransferase SpsG
VANPWLVIPARGGSRGVPRKNLRILVGIPLIAHTIKTALAATSSDRVIVITDDDEIAEVSLAFGAKVIREGASATGAATLDEVMLRHIPDLKALGASDEDLLLTMQPTCPLVSSERVAEAVAKFESGAGSVITVKDDRHLTWTIEAGKPKPLYSARVNRQQLPPQFRESGAIIGARISDVLEHKTRIVEPIALIELPENESLDIDTFSDLVVAEHWLTRRNILIHADAGKELGMGHVYRALALAQELARHNILIATTKSMPLGKEFFDGQVFQHVEIDSRAELAALAKSHAAQLTVLDILDTDIKLVQAIQLTGSKVVTFEDLGPGAEAADLLVSDLYPNPRVPKEKQLTGIENAILAPSFETLARKHETKTEVSRVLVLFGGTDPSELATKSLRALEEIGFAGEVVCIRGLGASDISAQDFKLNLQILRNVKNMPAEMAKADLALSSAGRTITELAQIGVPTICLAQNQKELAHTHATEANGVVNLGLGLDVDTSSLAKALSELIESKQLRDKLHQSSLLATKTRSNSNVVDRILRTLGL